MEAHEIYHLDLLVCTIWLLQEACRITAEATNTNTLGKLLNLSFYQELNPNRQISLSAHIF